LRLAIGDAVVLPLPAVDDAHQHVRAVGWHRRERRLLREEKHAVNAGVSDVGKAFQAFAYGGDGSCEERIEISAVFVDDALGNLLKASGAEFRHHAA
jgi:hypothetical protein